MFRLAHAMGGDTFCIDSDLLTAAQASAVLALALRKDASLLFLKRKVPYKQTSALVARAGCPYFQAMAEPPLRRFDYAEPQWAGISRLHLIHDHFVGPATYVQALELVRAERGPAIPCHDLLLLLQQHKFPRFCLSAFSGERLVQGVGRGLAYKRSNDNWKLLARGVYFFCICMCPLHFAFSW